MIPRKITPLGRTAKKQALRNPKPHLAAELFEKMGKPGWALRNRLAHSGKNRSFYKTPQGGIAVLSENAGKKAEARGWKKLSITQVWAMLGWK